MSPYYRFLFFLLLYVFLLKRTIPKLPLKARRRQLLPQFLQPSQGAWRGDKDWWPHSHADVVTVVLTPTLMGHQVQLRLFNVGNCDL